MEASPVVAADNPRFVVFGRNYSSERVGATALIGSFPGLMGVGSDISTAALAEVGAEFTTYSIVDQISEALEIEDCHAVLFQIDDTLVAQ